MVRRVDAYETILKLRTTLRDRCATDVATATLSLDHYLRIYDAEGAEAASETNACRDAVAEGEVERSVVLQFGDYHVAQQAAMAKSKANLNHAADALAQCRSALNKADVAVRVIQSLRDRKLLAERSKRDRRERNELEDRIGAYRCE